ncbi:MAG: hypothetical protein GC181_11570 [Bacteroidetes bacterium]|nr:hypothetical protein [Bacteroidota bacterium]
MKHLFVFILFSIVFSGCQKSSEDCFDCFTSHLTTEQAALVTELHNLFLITLEKAYPEIPDVPGRMRKYAEHLQSGDSISMYESLNFNQLYLLWKKYVDAGLIHIASEEYQILKNKPAFQFMFTSRNILKALRPCLHHSCIDSASIDYVDAYDNAGDISPDRFRYYTEKLAKDDALNNRIYQFLFGYEYFLRDALYCVYERDVLMLSPKSE